MNQLRILFIFICPMILFACGGSGNQSTPDTDQPTPPNIPTTLESVVKQAAQSVDGIILFIDKKGLESVMLSEGIRRRNMTTPLDGEELFKIASISKLFIAVATTKLVSEGTLRLDDTLGMWLPDLVDKIQNAEVITLEQLIKHRSGVPDFDSQVGFSWENSHEDINETLDFALGLAADFAPNEKYEYSNTNYLLIAKILDTALGFEHAQYIESEIVNKLGLKNTYVYPSQVNFSELVSGYWFDEDRKEQTYNIPGGSMISTAREVAYFIRQLNKGNELLTPEQRELYHYFFSHSGWLPGYQSIANYYSDIDTVIVQFINTTGAGSEVVATTTLEQTLTILRSQ